MKTRCPVCGACNSLDSLIASDDARAAISAALAVCGDLKPHLIKYLGLFRAQQRDLSFDRVAKILAELTPDISRQSISRNRQTYPAPVGAWVWAIERCLERRDLGQLSLPLKNHGYLYEIISNYKAADHAAPIAATRPSTPNSSPKVVGDTRPRYEQMQDKC